MFLQFPFVSTFVNYIYTLLYSGNCENIVFDNFFNRNEISNSIKLK